MPVQELMVTTPFQQDEWYKLGVLEVSVVANGIRVRSPTETVEIKEDEQHQLFIRALPPLRLQGGDGEVVVHQETGNRMCSCDDVAASVVATPAPVAVPPGLEEVQALGLNWRTLAVLRAGGIVKTSNLIARTEEDLLEIQRFGVSALDDVNKRLAKLGMSLKPE